MNPNHQLADTIRNVTVAMQKAIDEGHRSRVIDADDLVEVLLAIADQLDPPVTSDVSPKTAQALARHSTIDLTMNVYTSLTVTDQAAALNTLPSVPACQ